MRDRKEDIPLLVKHFLNKYSKENKKDITGFTEGVMEILVNNDWPGNIRELENLIERSVVLTKSKVITRESLPSFLLTTKKDGTVLSQATNELNLKEHIQTFQREAIISALEKTKGIQKKAASILGVKPTTLNEMIKRLNINITNLS